MSVHAHRALAGAAAVLAVGAALAGSPFRAGESRLDVRGIASVVEREEDHVSALELARWIREKRSGLRVVDVRPRADYDAYSIPGAESFTLDSLVRERFARNATVVLYSEGGAHAAQAWVLLRARGVDRVYFLRGGLFEWIEQVMEPSIAENAPEAEQASWTEISALSRYFGGSPRIGPPRELDAVPLPTLTPAQTEAAVAAAAVARVKRRGC